MSYEHLRLEREAPLTERHPRRGMGGPPPTDVRAHGARLAQKLGDVRQHALIEDVGGFDDRKLLKISLRLSEKSLPRFDQIPGVEIVSQEDESVVLAFASDEGLATFESRLTALARDGTVTRKELLYAIEDFDRWGPQDRTGGALRNQGFPALEPFVLDVELWPQDRPDKRQALLDSFLGWLAESGVERLDDIQQSSLIMVRTRCNRLQAEQILRYRDVRTVDLPPPIRCFRAAPAHGYQSVSCGGFAFG